MLNAMFSHNNCGLSKQPIEVFWENHVAGERKAEGTIPPRGGHIDVNTYVGHGKFDIFYVCCFTVDMIIYRFEL